MRAVLLPLVLALLLSYLLRPFVRGFRRLRIPSAVSAGVILLSLIGTIVYAVSVLTPLASDWMARAPESLPQLQRKLLPLKQPIESVARAGSEIEKLATPNNGPTKPVVEVKRHSLIDVLYVQTPEVIASTVILLILLYFLLAYDGAFMLRVIKLLPKLSDKKRAVSIANDIEAQISRYLLTVTVINGLLGDSSRNDRWPAWLTQSVHVGRSGVSFELRPLLWGPHWHNLYGLGRDIDLQKRRICAPLSDDLFRSCGPGRQFHHPGCDGSIADAESDACPTITHLLGVAVGNRWDRCRRANPRLLQDFLRAP